MERGGGGDYTYVQLYDTLYIHMQEEINKLLTSEIATTVRKKQLLNICAKKEKPIYHNATENFSMKRKQKKYLDPLYVIALLRNWDS